MNLTECRGKRQNIKETNPGKEDNSFYIPGEWLYGPGQ